MPKCLVCGIELVKPEDFSLGDLSKNLCAQCRKPRISQTRLKPWQDSGLHKKFGQVKPPSENDVHLAYRRKLREQGKSDVEINQALRSWHRGKAA